MPEQPLDHNPLQDRLHIAERERDEARRWSQRLLWLLAATILLAVVSAGSAGWWWAKLEAERAEWARNDAERGKRETEARLQRERQIAQDVQRSLDAADQLLKKNQNINQMDLWNETILKARAALERAEALLQHAPDDEALRERLHNARKDLELHERDRQMIRELEDVRLGKNE